MKPAAVIFDCDGVLVDSEPIAFALLAEEFSAHGMEMTRAEMQALFLGGTIKAVSEQARALGVGFPDDWHLLNEAELANAVIRSMGLVRFYMTTLKAEAYIHLRLGDIKAGRERLQKVAELDSSDHFGARALLDMLANSETVRELEESVTAG